VRQVTRREASIVLLSWLLRGALALFGLLMIF
jgi:hypothetical protein